MHLRELGRSEQRLGIAFVTNELVGHLELFEQPQYPLRPGALEMMDRDHGPALPRPRAQIEGRARTLAAAAMDSRRAILFAILGLGCTPHELPSDGPAPPEPAPPVATIVAPERPVVASVDPTPGGCFAAVRSYDIGFPPFLADVADVDGDDDVDLVVASILGRDLVFVANDGAGGLAVGKRIDIEVEDRHGLALGDVDNDRKVDVVTFDPRGGDVFVRAGDGTGDFGRSTKLALQKQVYGGTLHDLDGDGNLDLVTQHLRHLGVHRGRGDGGFATVEVLPVAQAPEYVRAVDLDRDGSLDLVSASNDEAVLSRIRGKGELAFGREARDRCGDGPHELAIADLDDDGRLDVAMATMHSRELCIFRQQDAGELELIVRRPFVTEALAAADLDDDGAAEIVVTDASEGGLRVLALAGKSGALVERGRSTTGHNPHALWLRDLDADGRLDAVMLDGFQASHIWHGDTLSYEPRETTVSVALGRACDSGV
ncbi:MAG TPA: VCBS repeat-containing protein [Nannocystaceae bacterium]|nr:VCBS repeat-containing protein [Nannocystaceae bacterium]